MCHSEFSLLRNKFCPLGENFWYPSSDDPSERMLLHVRTPPRRVSYGCDIWFPTTCHNPKTKHEKNHLLFFPCRFLRCGAWYICRPETVHPSQPTKLRIVGSTRQQPEKKNHQHRDNGDWVSGGLLIIIIIQKPAIFQQIIVGPVLLNID